MTESIRTRCCVVGGGPAGMMLGVLLARTGVDVVVLEKHADFLRDFRGDTIHPSTLEVIHELDWLDAFLALPHQRVDQLVGRVYGQTVEMADFSHLPVICPYIAMMPQWDFLDFLARQGARYRRFGLRMNTQATGLIKDDDGKVVGVTAIGPEGDLRIDADLVVACDGRHTTMRAQAGLTSDKLGAPIDVLWFRVPRSPQDVSATGGYVNPGSFFVTINRGDYWQCADVIAKGDFEALMSQGIDAWRTRLASIAPGLAEGFWSITSWDQVSLLTVEIDRMPRWWQKGFLCIGDAAHAMSPVGGVGINLAIQDAVATANLLGPALRDGPVSDHALASVQSRREWPVRATQQLQIAVQNNVITPMLAAAQAAAAAGQTTGSAATGSAADPLEGAERATPPELPLPMRMMQRFAVLRRLPARLVGMGLRPEHIGTPEILD